MSDRIKHIMESGLLEEYLLGIADAKTTQEIESLLTSSNELREAFAQLEEVQFQMTETIAVKPPPALKYKIKDAIKSTPVSNENLSASPNKPNSRKWLYLLLIIPLIALIALSIWMNNAINLIKQDSIELRKELELKENTLADLQENMSRQESQLAFINHSSTQKIVLNGNNKSPDLSLIAFWNKETKESAIIPGNFENPSETTCFQLWADVDGEMLSLGVLESLDEMVNIDFLENATSLNITIEPKGGSDHPNVANLVASKALI